MEKDRKQKLIMGLIGITLPGLTDCMNKINIAIETSRSDVFQDGQRPHMLTVQKNFVPMRIAQLNGEDAKVIAKVLEAINILKAGGAAFAFMTANTTHQYIKEIQQASPIPILNMLSLVANKVSQLGYKNIGILGTLPTMRNNLYAPYFDAHGITGVVPNEEEQRFIHEAIISGLISSGTTSPETLASLISIINKFKDMGCDAVLLGCTELPLVLNNMNSPLPVVDTTAIFAEEAVKHYCTLIGSETLLLADAPGPSP